MKAKSTLKQIFFYSLILFLIFPLYGNPVEKNSTDSNYTTYQENTPLYFGNPSKAAHDISSAENYLMEKKQFSLSYNSKTLCPNWVGWHLSKKDLGEVDRGNDFRADSDLPDEWYAVKKTDYKYNLYGYDRGHICPSADRTSSKEDNSITFLMTNMVPQSPDNNRKIWMHFENFERSLVQKGYELYIFAGPYGTGGTGAKGYFEEIPVIVKSGEIAKINVPAFTWKVLIAIPEGTDDINRITEETVSIAINVPNQMEITKNGDWEQYICSINEIENLTGYDFFDLLPDDIEEKIESSVYR